MEVELVDFVAQLRSEEMYRDSGDFKLLTRVMTAALRGFLERSDVALSKSLREDYGLVLWAAVYPGNGGRHGYHVHQGSASSCVLYARVAGRPKGWSLKEVSVKSTLLHHFDIVYSLKTCHIYNIDI